MGLRRYGQWCRNNLTATYNLAKRDYFPNFIDIDRHMVLIVVVDVCQRQIERFIFSINSVAMETVGCT